MAEIKFAALHTVISMKTTDNEIYTNVIKLAINTVLPFYKCTDFPQVKKQ